MAKWRQYVPVAKRRATAQQQLGTKLKKGEPRNPVVIEGSTIVKHFWGRAWCKHLESYSDYRNRLPRGKTYVRNGSVCHLNVEAGEIVAHVSGSRLYTVSITIEPLDASIWDAIKRQVSGQVGSIIELLQGKLSEEVMRVVTDPVNGLFPDPQEISMHCTCPDWAVMCKHVAATLYGVGNRLDIRPDLLFQLRGVDPQDLFGVAIALPATTPATHRIADDALSSIFGIALDMPMAPAVAANPQKNKSTAATKAKPPTAAAVRRLRKKLALTTAEMAKKIRVSEATVLRWESSNGPLRLQSRSLATLTRFIQENTDR